MALVFSDMSEQQRKKKMRDLDNRSYSSYSAEELQFLDDWNNSKTQSPKAGGNFLKERGSAITKAKNKKFHSNIENRGHVDIGVAKKREEETKLNPYLIGFLVFVVVGSGIFGIIQTMASGQIF